MKVPRLIEEVVVKYQQFIQFTIGLHAIHVQARWDLDRQWLETQFKLAGDELDAMVVE